MSAKFLHFVCILMLKVIICNGIDKDTLRLSQIFFRHGDRSPALDFPTNPYKADAWINGFGELTQLGIRQAYDLGKLLRNRYDGFLNATYVKDEVFVRSSDTDRTLMSASALLAGLYPPQGFQQWDPEIPWQPIPVHTVPLEDDIELMVNVKCPLRDALHDEVLQSDYGKQFMSDNKDMIEYITSNAGLPPFPPDNAWRPYDVIKSIRDHPELGYSPPLWVTPEVEQWMVTHEGDIFALISPTPRLKYITTGPSLYMLSSRMEDARGEDVKGRKLILYSEHDASLTVILIALGVWDRLRPSYASALIFELHEPQPDTYTVQVYYKNDTVDNPLGKPMQITIAGCEMECPLNDFLNILAPMLYRGSVDDWHEECLKNPSFKVTGAAVTITVLTLSGIVVLSVIVYLLVIKQENRPSYSSI